MENSLIRNTPALNEACARAKASGVVALDTEFVWNRTYRPVLGLVQIGANGVCQALDCLQGTSPQSLGDIIADASVVKILHDAHQDLEHLWHYTGAKPLNVFDTQCAAAFAGFPSGIGLQKLLQEAINVGLPKTETLTDWTQRPLTDAQVDYALDDVRYLEELRKDLLARADRLGTRAFLEEELGKYDDPDWYAVPDPDEAWQRIKTGKARLERRHFAILRALAAARESAAQEWNLPRNWLGDDLSLVEMTLKGRVSFFRHRLRGGQRDAMEARYAAALREALALPENEWPDDPWPHYMREVTEAAEKAVEWLRARAAEIRVDATLIASRATVTAFIDNPDDVSNPLSSGWRYDAVGREMLERFGV